MIPELEPGDIGFLMHHDNMISKIIAWFMGSKWSHTFGVLFRIPSRTCLLETSDFQVVISTFERYLKNPNVELQIFRPVRLSREQLELIAEKAAETEGTIYGYFQLISLGLRRLLMRVGIKIPNFIRQGMVCTHPWLYGYRHSDIPGLAGIDPESIDTEEFYQLCLNQNHFMMIFQYRGDNVSTRH